MVDIAVRAPLTIMNFAIGRDADWNDSLPRLTDDGAPYDLTGAILELQIRPTLDSPLLIDYLTSVAENGIVIESPAADGYARIYRAQSYIQAQYPRGKWPYFMRLIAPDGGILGLTRGFVEVFPGETESNIDVLLGSASAAATPIVASETIADNALVNIHNNSGVANIRNANANGAKRANGFVLAGGVAGATLNVYFYGIIPGSALSLGNPYYLAATAGTKTITAPSTSGFIVQEVGFAVSPTEFLFVPQTPVTLA